MQENSGLKVSDLTRLFRIIKKQIILFICSVLIVGILGAGIALYNNKNNIDYVAEFSNSFLMKEDTTLPNGNTLSYTDIVARENILQLKDKAEFSKVNIDKIIENGAISIQENYHKETEKTTYTIKVSTKYFPDAQTARLFVKELANGLSNNVVDEKLTTSLDNYDFSANYDEAVSYEEKLQCLSAQKDLLSSHYAILIETYNAGFYVNSQTLSHYKASIDNLTQSTELSRELSVENYAPFNKELVEKYKVKKAYLGNQKTILEETLNGIKNTLTGVTSIGDINVIADLNRQIHDYEYQIGLVDAKILKANLQTDEKRDAFETKLDSYKLTLQQLTNSYYNNLQSIYQNSLRASFTSSTIVSTEGQISVVIASSAGVLLGLILACFVVYVVDCAKTKNASNKAEPNQTKIAA